MIKAIVIGHLGKDAVVNNVNGKTVINFSVAHSEKWKDNNGVENQRTTWVDCSYWSEKTAIAQYLKKGTQVYVEGNMEPKLYKPQNGEPAAQLGCRVGQIQLLGGAKETGNNTNASQPTNNPATVNSDISPADDSLPF